MINPFLDNIQPFVIKNSNEFLNLVNDRKMVWVVSNRTNGKTVSLKNVLDKNNKNYFYINCNNFHSIEDFLKKLLFSFLNTYIIKKDLSELANIISVLRDSFSEVKIKFSIDSDNASIKLQSIEFKDLEKAMTEIFNELSKIAKEKSITLFFDEFDSLFLLEGKKNKELEKLKGILKGKISIIFVGNDRDLMQSYFTGEELQKKGATYFQLEKILETHWRLYITELFKKNLNKNVPQEILNFILDVSQLNPHYLRMLSSIVFEQMVRDQDLTKDKILKIVYLNNEKFYKEIVESLSLNQKKAITLIAHTEGNNVYKSENLKKIGLSKSSMERCITSFLTQRIINKNGMSMRIKDPLFERWIKDSFNL
jgi:hypothetical protein